MMMMILTTTTPGTIFRPRDRGARGRGRAGQSDLAMAPVADGRARRVNRGRAVVGMVAAPGARVAAMTATRTTMTHAKSQRIHPIQAIRRMTATHASSQRGMSRASDLCHAAQVELAAA